MLAVHRVLAPLGALPGACAIDAKSDHSDCNGCCTILTQYGFNTPVVRGTLTGGAFCWYSRQRAGQSRFQPWFLQDA